MFRNHHTAGASILVAVLATAALSGSSCSSPDERGQGSGSSGGVPIPPTCTDAILSGDETDKNCGGSCDPCKDGQTCLVALDCESGVCTSNACATPTCTDGVRNGAEGDADCGGSCTTPCADNKTCRAGSDCSSSACLGGRCVPHCTSSAKDSDESDIDCGGSCTAKCADTKTCKAGSDCSSTFCLDGACVPHCSSLAKDEDETDLDCGGSCATKCSVERNCKVSADCVSGYCYGGVCSVDPGSTQCTDGAKNGLETDKNCGGGACYACNVDDSCLLDSDCHKMLKCDPTLKSCQLP